MTAKNLSDSTLAMLISRVTETMLGMPLTIAPSQSVEVSQSGTSMVIDVPGPRPLRIALSAEGQGSARLSAALFSCDLAQVDEAMKTDALGELLNMAAGQVKNALRVDEALGLPQVVNPQSVTTGDKSWRQLRLSAGDVELVLSLADPDPSSEGEDK
jgi:hypothetical protein